MHCRQSAAGCYSDGCFDQGLICTWYRKIIIFLRAKLDRSFSKMLPGRIGMVGWWPFSGIQATATHTLPKHSYNVAITVSKAGSFRQGLEGQKQRLALCINGLFFVNRWLWWWKYLFKGVFLMKKWKELPQQLNRNTADAEWRADVGGLAKWRNKQENIFSWKMPKMTKMTKKYQFYT